MVKISNNQMELVFQKNSYIFGGEEFPKKNQGRVSWLEFPLVKRTITFNKIGTIHFIKIPIQIGEKLL